MGCETQIRRDAETSTQGVRESNGKMVAEWRGNTDSVTSAMEGQSHRALPGATARAHVRMQR